MIDRRSVIVVDDFYDNPLAIREFGLHCQYYNQTEYAVPDNNKAKQGELSVEQLPSALGWYSSMPQQHNKNKEAFRKLQKLIQHDIDKEHWQDGTIWNGCYQVKVSCSLRGIHNHSTNPYNGCGTNGWTAVVFLSPNPLSTRGLTLWEHRSGPLPDDEPYFVDLDYKKWHKTLEVENVFNRMVLMPSTAYHTGEQGWGYGLVDGRMVQTFFFRGKATSKQEALTNHKQVEDAKVVRKRFNEFDRTLYDLNSTIYPFYIKSKSKGY